MGPLVQPSAAAPLPDAPAKLQSCWRQSAYDEAIKAPRRDAGREFKALLTDNAGLESCARRWPEWYRELQAARAPQTRVGS